MKISFVKSFESREQLDAYVSGMRQIEPEATMSLSMSETEAATFRLDKATTVHGARIEIFEDQHGEAPPDKPVRVVLGKRKKAPKSSKAKNARK